MTKKDLIHSYLLLKINGSNDYSVRNGYYAITEINEIERKHTQNAVMAKGFYSNSATFLPTIEVEFQLNQLANKRSVGPKSILLNNLLGMVIHIQEVILEKYEYEGKPMGSYKVTWNFVGEIQEVIGHFRLKEQLDKRIAFESLSEDEQYDVYLQEELETIGLENENQNNDALIEEKWQKYLDEELKLICLENQLNEWLNEELLYDQQVEKSLDDEMLEVASDPNQEDLDSEHFDDVLPEE